MPSRPTPVRLSLTSLEDRSVPAALVSESFEAVRVPFAPAGFSSWGLGDYITSRITASDGVQALGSTGPANADSRAWLGGSYPASAPATVQVRSDAPTPVELLIQGRNLAAPSGTYVAAVVGASGRSLSLVEVNGDTRTTLATLAVAPAGNTWLTLGLRSTAAGLAATLTRSDTGQFLSTSGAWQSAPATALTAKPTLPAVDGAVGVGRRPGGAGMAFFDKLEVQSPPAVAISESFDATAAGRLPAGWAGWSSDGSAGFGAGAGASTSPGSALVATGTSRTAARAWVAEPLPADARAGANVLADSLVPAGVLIRGSGLGTAQSSYYAASVVRGVEVTISKVVNGIESKLGSVKSASYLSNVWLNVTLVASGSQLRALVRRLDTGDYLTAEGAFDAAPQPAVAATDSAITAAGQVGVVRGSGAAGAVRLDDFAASAADPSAAPQVSLTLSQPLTAVSGAVEVRPAISPAERVVRVEYRIDGVLRATQTRPGGSYSFDTTRLANGPHVFAVRALTDDGDAASASVTATVVNAASGAPSRPVVPRHYAHIRIAALAYSGNPLGAFERDRLRDSVDLVVANPQYAATIAQVSPATPQFLYSNVSNLYEGLLQDWLAYAGRTGADREAAFYHVTKPTAFTGSSPSSKPVSEFWAVARGPAGATPTLTPGQVDLTGAAKGGIAGVEFGGAGAQLAVAYPEKFGEVNLALLRGASAGWAGVVEYPTARDAAGNITAWAPLRLLGDTTGNFARSGTITFDAPANWVASGPANAPLYAVRIRTTSAPAGSAAPVAGRISGRDYVNAGGAASGTIPAFDAAADRDGDGALSAAEYANRAPGMDAKFAYESRLFYPYYGQMRFALNPSSPAVAAWAGDYHARLLAASPAYSGLFLDNSNGRLPIAGIAVAEPTASYGADYAALVRAVGKAIGPTESLIANTSGGGADADPVVGASGFAFEEFSLRPTEANWAAVADLQALIARRLNADSPQVPVILDSYPGDQAVGSTRVQSGTLAYYYLVGDPKLTYLTLAGGYSPAAPWKNAWIPAVSTDIGQPRGAAAVWAQGADPENAKLTYKVLRRDYDNAVVLYKPRSYAQGAGTGTISDATATTHELGGNYRVLNPDGTLGAVVRSVTLRGGEGVVLMRA